MSEPTKWEVRKDGYWDGKHWVGASCHHRNSGACSGCYARAMFALDDCKNGDTTAAYEVEIACQGESKRRSR